MEAVFKILIFIIISLFSFSALACFSPPPGLIEDHEFQARSFSAVAIIFLILALVLRTLSNLKRVWVPLLFVTTFTYWPAYIFYWGQVYSGSCGMPEIVFSFQILASGFGILFAYEVWHFYKAKRAK